MCLSTAVMPMQQSLRTIGDSVTKESRPPPPQGALDDEELFNVEGSKNPRTPRDSTPLGGVENEPNPPPNRH